MKTFILVLFILTVLHSNKAIAATIDGTILNKSLSPLYGVTVSCSGHSVLSNKKGKFILNGLKPGKTTLNLYYNGINQLRTIFISSNTNKVTLRFKGKKTKKEILYPELNLYGLSGFVEVFSSGFTNKKKQLFLIYSRTKKEGDYSYDTFHYHLYYKLADNLSTSLSLVDSTRVSKWFRNKKEMKSINLKYRLHSIPLAVGGSFSDRESFYFAAYDSKISQDEKICFNLKTLQGNLRKAALNVAYSKKLNIGSGIVEAIMKEDKYKVFNLGYNIDYKGLNYNIFYHRDNLDKIQSAGIGVRLNWK